MAKRKKQGRRTFTAKEKAGIMAKVSKAKAKGKIAAIISAGITPSLYYKWKSAKARR